MDIIEAISEIRKFWEGIPLSGDAAQAARLEEEFAAPFPDELRRYLSDYAPASLLRLQRVGNPLSLYGFDGKLHLGATQPGYNVHGTTGLPLKGWERCWFMLGDEGADPIIVDLSEGETQVLQAMHGVGVWEFWPVADNIGQFLLCAAAMHFTLENWSDDIAGMDDDGLPQPAAEWLFPRMRQWAGPHYDIWCDDFDNA